MASCTIYPTSVTRTVNGERVTTIEYGARATVYSTEREAIDLVRHNGLFPVRQWTWVRFGMTDEQARMLESALAAAGWEIEWRVGMPA